MRGCHDEAIAEARRAIDLGPGSADIAAFTSLVFNFSGHADEALLQIKKAMRLSPIYPAWYLGDLGFANRLLGRHEKAISAFREYGERSPGFGHIDLVIIYGELDRMEEARGEAVRLLAARPGFTITSWRRSQFYKNPARLDADVAALRKVGLPV
jgi:adenylate cyclase